MLGVTTRALESEKESVLFENLHERSITCLATNKSGDLFVTGSEDMSVRVWQISKGYNKRKLIHICSFAGHTDIVSCVDICSEYALIVSGSVNGAVCMWDYRTKRMIRILDPHLGCLLSVSIGHISGQIVTLTSSELRLYCLNGELVSCFSFRGDGILLDMKVPTIAISVPCADWQNGVVAVTGHSNGQFFLWKVSNGQKRKFSVCISPTKTHRCEITSLRLCSTSSSKHKGIVSKSFNDSRSMDLFVGDSDGFVSRWSPQKLDQFQSTELLNVLN